MLTGFRKDFLKEAKTKKKEALNAHSWEYPCSRKFGKVKGNEEEESFLKRLLETILDMIVTQDPLD